MIQEKKTGSEDLKKNRDFQTKSVRDTWFVSFTVMEIMSGGPRFSIEVSDYGNDQPAATEKASSSSSYGDTVNEDEAGLSRIWSGKTVDYSSESSSSIGSPGDSEEDEESEDEELGLSSMSSLEDSLLSK